MKAQCVIDNLIDRLVASERTLARGETRAEAVGERERGLEAQLVLASRRMTDMSRRVDALSGDRIHQLLVDLRASIELQGGAYVVVREASEWIARLEQAIKDTDEIPF